jgi:hypothetical protein
MATQALRLGLTTKEALYMPLLIELLEIIGVQLGRAGATGWLAGLVARLTQTLRRWPAIYKQLVAFVASALAMSDDVVEYVEGKFNWIKEGVTVWLEEVTGEIIDNLDRESIINAGGKAAAKEIDRQLRHKYGLSFPIENVASPDLPDELGVWFADLINQAISQKLGYDVQVFTTVFPYENIPQELDTFISEALSEALGVQIDSVLDIPAVKETLKTAFFDRIAQEVNERLAVAKSEVMQELLYLGDGIEFTDEQRLLISTVVNSKINDIALNLSAFFPNKKFYFKPSARLYNKLRQRKFRQTHRQQTIWVPR